MRGEAARATKRLMAPVLTIAMNPSVDIASEVDRVIPSRKLRCGPARRDPGGGGVGCQLRELVSRENIRAFAIDAETREDFTVFEHASGQE
jgi:6-phosphofructokinase 2